MTREDRALAPLDALARAEREARAAGDPVAEAEARLRALLDEIAALDAEVEALADALAGFQRRVDAVLGGPYADLARAERLVRRLQALVDAADGLSGELERGEVRRRGASRRRRPPPAAAGHGRTGPDPQLDAFPEPGEPDPDAAPDPPPATGATAPGEPPDDPAVALKRLYRRLARALHPDLAGTDADRERLGRLMADLNAAHARGDLAALEIMAERIGADLDPTVTPAERHAHLARRIATMGSVAASLRRERDRLAASRTARLRAEAAARAQAGGDWFEEALREAAEDLRACHADALARLDRLTRAARELERARRKAMTKLDRRGGKAGLRAFDPLAESPVVRAAAARLERGRATAEARALGRALEEDAAARRWEAALTLLAFFAEEAGTRPPDALAGAEGWAARWERLRAALPGAPELPRALGRLPRHLEVGLRAARGGVGAGVQLAAPDLVAGVRIALDRAPVAALAREVLAALGPETACAGCGPVLALHLLRTRGLDERHGHVCPSCGEVLRSFWRYGEAEGFEALAPHARSLGLVAEVTASLAGTSIGFGLLPAEREALTAAGLRRRFAELYLAQYEVALDPQAVAVSGARGPLGPGAKVAGERRLELGTEGAELSPEALLELLRGRIERRFRPG